MSLELSVVYPYYNNPEMIKHHLQNWELLPDVVKSRVEFIIVDDGSTFAPLERGLVDAIDANLKAYVIHEDIPWNVGGAKNLGAYNASGRFLLFTDIDRLLPSSFLERCLELASNTTQEYYVFKQINSDGTKRRGFHQGTVLVDAKRFWEVRGYDEDFSGAYGHEDGHFLKKLRAVGLRHTVISDVRLVAFDNDASFPDSKTPADQYGSRHENGPLSKQKGSQIPEELDILRFTWSAL